MSYSESLSAYFDPATPRPLTSRGWLALALVLLATGLPSLALPLGADQAMFFVTAQKLNDGAMLYRDAVDVKPPPIYHGYALAAATGLGAFAVRLLDLAAQLLTALLIIGLLRRSGAGDATAALAGILYMLLYYSFRFSDLAQCESYTGLFGIGAIWLASASRTRRAAFVAGLACGLLCLVKYTLLAVIIAPAVVMLFDRGATLGNRAIRIAMLTLGCASALGLLAAYISAQNLWPDVRLVLAHTSAYGSLEYKDFSLWLSNLVRLLPLHLATDYTPLALIPTAWAIAMSMRRNAGAYPEPLRPVMLMCSLAFLAMLVTVVVEAKYGTYQFARILAFGAPLAAVGMAAGLCRLLRSPSPGRRRMLAAAAVVLALAAGPLVGYSLRTVGLAAQRASIAIAAPDTSPGEAAEMVLAPRSMFGAYPRMFTPARDSDLVVISCEAGLVYFYSGAVPPVATYLGQYVTAPFAAPVWADSLRSYIRTVRPAMIVADAADSLKGITGTARTSLMTLRSWPDIDSLLRRSYRERTLRVAFRPQFNRLHLVVFERIDPAP